MKINPKQMEKLARRMGMQMTEIPAEEVVIKTHEKDIVIKEPHISKVNMMGQETFQITGEISEREKERFSEKDIRMIMEQTGAGEEEAEEALDETNDIAGAILKLKKERESR
jgi:nascent polypeptide-associated complex subunit alpha